MHGVASGANRGGERREVKRVMVLVTGHGQALRESNGAGYGSVFYDIAVMPCPEFVGGDCILIFSVSC